MHGPPGCHYILSTSRTAAFQRAHNFLELEIERSCPVVVTVRAAQHGGTRRSWRDAYNLNYKTHKSHLAQMSYIQAALSA